MAKGATKAGTVNTEGMNPVFRARLQQLVAASGGRVTIYSGYRDEAHQRRLWEAALKKYGSAEAADNWVAPPGQSYHGKGLAADLRGDLKWAKANAARFGLWFPLSNEDWHIELAGSRGGKAVAGTATATGGKVPKGSGSHAGHAHDDADPPMQEDYAYKDANYWLETLNNMIQNPVANVTTEVNV